MKTDISYWRKTEGMDTLQPVVSATGASGVTVSPTTTGGGNGVRPKDQLGEGTCKTEASEGHTITTPEAECLYPSSAGVHGV